MKNIHYYHPLACAVALALSAQYTLANTETVQLNNTTEVLDEIVVTESRYAHERQNEVTGLGKVVKNYDQMSKNQILSIRDLTRYDPGISVVEQGRGASSGYAIRGVDKNRVSMLVDGLPQAQHYNTLGSTANGGAINEIEYENIRSIELSKGASSAEYGSGALGGAVGFQTKDPQDIIKDGQNWGVDSKTAYVSKNSQVVQSVAAAGEAGGFEAMLIATYRQGKDTKIHSAATDYYHSIERLTGYENRYDLFPNSTQNEPGGNFFLIKENCPALNCSPRATVKLNRNDFPIRTEPTYSEEEQKQLAQIPYRKEQLSAKEYTGEDRIAPNPLDYKSQSVFTKLGYRFNPSHYVGGVLEDTKQRYDMQDMLTPAYYTKSDVPKNINLFSLNSSIYEGDNILDGLVFDYTVPYGTRYTRAKFFDEWHHKRRTGLSYEYQPESAKWLDKLTLHWDKQFINLFSRMHRLHCSDYPSFDKHCRPSLDKPWAMYETERNDYREKHNIIRLELSKTAELGEQGFKHKHKFHLGVGVDKFRSDMKHGDFYAQYTQAGYINEGKVDDTKGGGINNPYIYSRKPRSIVSKSFCDNTRGDILNCNVRSITGHNHFISLRDLITSQYIDLGLGVRFDKHQFKSDDKWTISDTYRNWSWNAGVSIKPTDFVAFAYRISNGFRVPAFYELYGRRQHIGDASNPLVQKENLNRKLDPEKSTNHEWGISFKGNFGYIDASYFRNNYDGMIAEGCKKESNAKVTCIYNYHNIQDVKLRGFNVNAKFDLHGMIAFVPDGFYSSLAYNKVKLKERKLVDPTINSANDPTLEAIQPGRYVVGLGYDHPEEKWGIGITTTYSKAKKADEITGVRYYGQNKVDLGGKITRAWYTHDLTGYINYKNYTVRAGIYNVTNRKYTTWESVRQSAVNAVNRDMGNNYTRFAAPGRNFSLSFEMKF